MSLETKTKSVEGVTNNSGHWGEYSAQEVWNFLDEFGKAGPETRVFLLANKKELVKESLEYGRHFHRLQQKYINNGNYQKLKDYVNALNKTKFKKRYGFRSLEK